MTDNLDHPPAPPPKQLQRRETNPRLPGNTSDGEEKPVVPVKTVDRTTTHTAKRNTDGLAPSKAPAVTGNRRGGANFSGNEAGV